MRCEGVKMSQRIKYPYMPEDGVILYVPISDPHMAAAREFARANSLDKTMPNASLLIRDGVEIGSGANGSRFHLMNECERIRLKCPTGTGYDLCEGCHPRNHGEPKAIEDALFRGNPTAGADLYLWGHWWCCEPCWDAMRAAGVTRVFLLERSEILFNKSHPEHVIGRQFET